MDSLQKVVPKPKGRLVWGRRHFLEKGERIEAPPIPLKNTLRFQWQNVGREPTTEKKIAE